MSSRQMFMDDVFALTALVNAFFINNFLECFLT